MIHGFLDAHGYDPGPSQRPLLSGAISGILATVPAIGILIAFHSLRVEAAILGLPRMATLGIGWVIWGLVAWNKGSSPAFQVLGLRAYHIDSGRPAGFWRMALRDIVGYAVSGFFGITWLVSFVMFCASGKRQTIADLCATTVVVHDPNHALG